MKVYFHIGAGKCASSAIQEALVFSDLARGKFIYGAIDSHGKVSVGEEIKSKARGNAFNYVTSTSLKAVSSFDKFNEEFQRSIANLSLSYDAVVFSNEGWKNEIDRMEKVLSAMKQHKVTIIFIVRPPVEWMNSAWWQWGRWTDVDLDVWIDRNLKNVQWFDVLSRCSMFDEKIEVNVLALTEGVINDFSKLIGYKLYDPERVSNVGSDFRILRFMGMARSLRPGPHDSRFEFCLNRYIQKKGSPDWVISRRNAGKIIQATRESNISIAPFVLNEDIKNDRRWWGQGYYRDVDKRLCIDGYLANEILIDLLQDANRALKELHDGLQRIGASPGRLESLDSIPVVDESTERWELIATIEALFLRICKYDLMLRQWESN